MKTQLLFVQNTPPHGSITGQEGLDACLMGSAFADCAMLFLEDGIYQILSTQDTAMLGVKDYSVSFAALADYGVSNLYCRASDLLSRGIDQAQLGIDVQSLSDDDAKKLISLAGQVLTF